MDGSLSSESIACFGWWISVSEMRGKGARGIGVGKLRGGGGRGGVILSKFLEMEDR